MQTRLNAMRRTRRPALCAAAMLLACALPAGCATPGLLPAQNAASGTVPPEQTITQPTAAPLPAATSTPVSADPAATVDFAPTVGELFEGSLGIDFENRDPSAPGIESVAVFEVTPPQGQPRHWVAHTVGLRDFAADQAHVIAIYTQVGEETVAELTRFILREDPSAAEPTSMPDYLAPGGVRQAQIEPSALWLAVEGGAGAHSGVYHLLRLSDDCLVDLLAAFSSSPGVGEERDLNGDGIAEVLTDATEYYVFCYACGVRIPGYGLWRWTGAAMEQVLVESLPAEASEAAYAANDSLMTLAAHGLWQEVESGLAGAEALVGEDPSGTLAWNLALLRLNAEARRAQVENPSPYPLLDHVFYGDAAGAEAMLRAYTPQEIFSPQSPLIVDTVAEGWEETLATWVERSAGDWLEVHPDLAPAYLLRAWAAFLVGEDEAMVRDLEVAAASGDPFYTAALDWVR